MHLPCNQLTELPSWPSNDPQSTVGLIPECRPRSNPGVLLGVPPELRRNKNNKTPTLIEDWNYTFGLVFIITINEIA